MVRSLRVKQNSQNKQFLMSAPAPAGNPRAVTQRPRSEPLQPIGCRPRPSRERRPPTTKERLHVPAPSKETDPAGGPFLHFSVLFCTFLLLTSLHVNKVVDLFHQIHHHQKLKPGIAFVCYGIALLTTLNLGETLMVQSLRGSS